MIFNFVEAATDYMVTLEVCYEIFDEQLDDLDFYYTLPILTRVLHL